MRCQLSLGMSKREKLLAKAKRNPAGLKFREFTALLSASGYVYDRQKGSHERWINDESGNSMTIQPWDGGMAAPYQVRQFLSQIGG